MEYYIVKVRHKRLWLAVLMTMDYEDACTVAATYWDDDIKVVTYNTDAE